MDFHHHHQINYSEFLAICVDRRKVISKHNLLFAFHHFEETEKGFITAESLVECFRREGKHLTTDEVNEIMKDVKHSDKTRISFEEFDAYMQDLISNDNHFA